MIKLKNIGLLMLFMAIVFTAFDADVYGQKRKKAPKAPKEKKVKKKKGEVEEIVEEAKPWKDTKNEFGCFVYGEDSIKALQTYSLYREDYKNDNIEGALPKWEYIYANAPGLREQTFKDGEQMFKKFYEEETDPAKKQAHFDKLMEIYDQRALCWGESALTIGKKGLRYVEYFPEEKETAFDYLSKSIENGGNEVDYPVLGNHFKIILDKYREKTINRDELDESYSIFKEISEHNIANNEKKSAKYQKLYDDFTGIYEKMTTVTSVKTRPDIQDCAAAEEYYGGKYRENPTDPTAIQNYYASMIKFRCTGSSQFLEIAKKYNEMEPSSSKTKFIAKAYADKGDMTTAMTYYKQAMDMETDPSKKANLKMNVANIVYKNGSKGDARKLAREAADLRPNWGAPWILIGLSYASQSSGCSDNFDKRAAIWVAMDMWSKAKRVDPASADKAQKYISKYAGSLPGKKDIFQRNLSKGQSYTVPCLGVSTTVRY